MLTNEQRLNLINRLNVLQQEIGHIARTLYDNPCPVTSDDIERAVKTMMGGTGYLELSSLERQLETGMAENVLATYHPNAAENKVRAYSSDVDSQMLLVFERLIEIKHYRIVEGDENAQAFCVHMVRGEAAKDNSKALFQIIVTEEEPVQPLIKIGPNSVIRQKASEETLTQHLEMCGLSRIDFEEQVAKIRDTVSDKAVHWVSVPEVKKRD